MVYYKLEKYKKQVIAPESLRTVDTTEIITPYGNDAKVPVQKYRDNMKIWAAMYDGKVVYVLLGSENQSNIHYAMPPKNMLYDSINYASQVDAARASYKGFMFPGSICCLDKLGGRPDKMQCLHLDRTCACVTKCIHFWMTIWVSASRVRVWKPMC